MLTRELMHLSAFCFLHTAYWLCPDVPQAVADQRAGRRDGQEARFEKEFASEGHVAGRVRLDRSRLSPEHTLRAAAHNVRHRSPRGEQDLFRQLAAVSFS